ncbi:mitochondrial peripheral inner membrane protein [Perkinsus chesapeaki]|uniref:Mitochondrial peripheral inner membrane protein n=1 Tax=Perkinsus chesapeaki TaxID=330153 RepID=A0A7J6L9Q2_PERCH|nr:mitochondrial peripheral inner membrane protein [Perkinsus chesapeaki]
MIRQSIQQTPDAKPRLVEGESVLIESLRKQVQLLSIENSLLVKKADAAEGERQSNGRASPAGGTPREAIKHEVKELRRALADKGKEIEELRRGMEEDRRESEMAAARGNMEAEARLERANKEVECIKRQLKMADEETDKIWAERVYAERRLRDIIEQGDEKLHKMSAEMASLKVIMEERDKALRIMETRVVAARDIIRHDETTLERRTRELTEECEGLREEYEKVKEGRAAAEERLAHVEREMVVLQKECEKLRGETKQLPVVTVKLAEYPHRRGCPQLGLNYSGEEWAEQVARGDRELANRRVAEKELKTLRQEMEQLLLKMREDIDCVQVETLKRELHEARVMLTERQEEAAKSREELCRLRADLDLMKTSQLERLAQENDRLKRRSMEAQQLMDEAHEETLRPPLQNCRLSAKPFSPYKDSLLKRTAGDADGLRKEKGRLEKELENVREGYGREIRRLTEEANTYKKITEVQGEKLKRLEALQRDIGRIDVAGCGSGILGVVTFVSLQLHGGLSALQTLARTMDDVSEYKSGGEETSFRT